MKRISFAEALSQILKKDSRYTSEAYQFVRESLDFTIKTIAKKSPDAKDRHVSGQELLEGIRQYALQEYGPMSFTVLETWGVRKCEDFGEIVFNLVGTGVFGKTEKDSRDDFKGGYDFHEAFRKPFRPERSGQNRDVSAKCGQ